MPYSINDKVNAMLGCHDAAIVTSRGGGNSVVYCVEANGKKVAVKSYPPYAPDKRDRLAAETMVYEFLHAHHVSRVPKWYAASSEHRLLIMDWIEGDVPLSYSIEDIEQAIQFIASIASLNALPAAKQLPLAAEACLSLTILIKQITTRLQRLQSASENEPELAAFLSTEFIPLFMNEQQRAHAGYDKDSLDAEAELPACHQSLIPADFGFHNAIRDAHGALYFFDFDYFGWDDPVKLLADILWHPKMFLSEPQKQRFIDGISHVYRADTTFLARFHHTLGLFGLRWSLIFLNEFLPEFWQNRQHAAVHDNQAEAKINQLERARATLASVQQIGSHYDSISKTSL